MDEYDPDDLEKGDAFEYAAEVRRRILIRILLEDDSEHQLREFAREGAAREDDIAPETVDEEVHEQVELSLSHTDLPKLAQENVVEFDRDEGTVAPGENIDDLDPLV